MIRSICVIRLEIALTVDESDNSVFLIADYFMALSFLRQRVVGNRDIYPIADHSDARIALGEFSGSVSPATWTCLQATTGSRAHREGEIKSQLTIKQS